MLKIAVLFGVGVILVLGGAGLVWGVRSWFSDLWSSASESVTNAFSGFSFGKWFGAWASSAVPADYADPIINSEAVVESYGTMRLRQEKQRQARLAAEHKAHKARMAEADERVHALKKEAADHESCARDTAEEALQDEARAQQLLLKAEAVRHRLANPGAYQLSMPEESEAEQRQRIASMEETSAMLAEGPQRQAHHDILMKDEDKLQNKIEQEREAFREMEVDGLEQQAQLHMIGDELSELGERVAAVDAAIGEVIESKVKEKMSQMKIDIIEEMSELYSQHDTPATGDANGFPPQPPVDGEPSPYPLFPTVEPSSDSQQAPTPAGQ